MHCYFIGYWDFYPIFFWCVPALSLHWLYFLESIFTLSLSLSLSLSHTHTHTHTPQWPLWTQGQEHDYARWSTSHPPWTHRSFDFERFFMGLRYWVWMFNSNMFDPLLLRKWKKRRENLVLFIFLFCLI